MSKMRSNLKPPLRKSPIRPRSRRVLQSNSPSLQTPPGSLKKSQKLTRICEADMEPELRADYHAISCELRALAKMVKVELRNEDKTRNAATNLGSVIAESTPVFERGRFYDEYSARRNERLKRKTGEAVEEAKATPYNLGVTVGLKATKRRGTAKKQQLESLKKSVSTAYTETPRYMLRSMTKDNKNPPLPVNIERSVTVSAMKTVTTRRGRRI